MRSGPIDITVAACTRQRPDMLSDLIASWAALDTPHGTALRFLIVENDATSESADAVAAAAGAHGISVDYVLETEPGIPFARNRAAKEAIAAGSDLLAFMDDDEVASAEWLQKLVEGYRKSEAVLLGAPLRATAPDTPLTRSQTAMFDRVAARYREKEERAARLATLNSTDGVTIVTNNWLADLRLFTDHGIWFDEAMRYTGGTDAKFYAETVAKGLPTGWVADAIVSETIPKERLSFSYQLRRSRDQSNTNFRRKIAKNPWARLSVLWTVPTKSLIALLIAISLPFTGGKATLKLARALGWIVGRLGALVGVRSELYKQVTGH